MPPPLGPLGSLCVCVRAYTCGRGCVCVYDCVKARARVNLLHVKLRSLSLIAAKTNDSSPSQGQWIKSCLRPMSFSASQSFSASLFRAGKKKRNYGEAAQKLKGEKQEKAKRTKTQLTAFSYPNSSDEDWIKAPTLLWSQPCHWTRCVNFRKSSGGSSACVIHRTAVWCHRCTHTNIILGRFVVILVSCRHILHQTLW